METLIEAIIKKAQMKLQSKHWTCFCNECTLNEIRRLTDDELFEIIKNYDANFMD